jgi:hypothetical protein
MNRGPKYRIFFSAMIFAFMWVIIGDLVSMHIKVIYGDDIQKHQPFSKTDKSGKKDFKVKSTKTSNYSKKIDSSKFFTESAQATFLQNTKDFLYWFVPKLIAENNSTPSQGRAPPC